MKLLWVGLGFILGAAAVLLWGPKPPQAAADVRTPYYPQLADPVNLYLDDHHYYAGVVTEVERPVLGSTAKSRVRLTAFPPGGAPITSYGFLGNCADEDPPCYYPWANMR